jgi:transposase
MELLAGENGVPAAAIAMFKQMGAHIEALNDRISALDGELTELHKANSLGQFLAAIPGVGALGAITMTLTEDPANFALALHFVAWPGLTPEEKSTARYFNVNSHYRAPSFAFHHPSVNDLNIELARSPIRRHETDTLRFGGRASS